MLDVFGFAPDQRPGVLITIDKLDKVGPSGVVAELRGRGVNASAVDAFAAYLDRPASAPSFDEAGIRATLPDGIPDEIVAHLVDLGDTVAAARGGEVPLVFDPFLVRGMGYYTGTIFELAHPSVDYSLGGGGRYDGMIGRFLGQQVPAVGFSIGFERIVDLLPETGSEGERSVVLVHDRDVPFAQLLSLKTALIGGGARVRVEQRPKNMKALLERSTADGYASFATVNVDTTPETLEIKPLS